MYVTIYTRTIRRRKTRMLETVGCVYQTKSLTGMHELIRQRYADAITVRDPERIITDFVPGMNLGTFPLVTGGTFIAGANFPYDWKSSAALAELRAAKRARAGK